MLRMAIQFSDDVRWQPECAADLAAAIARIERELPGWWWSVGACHVSSDASIGPDRKGPAAWLLSDRRFDDGFHADLQRPSTCAQALHACIDEALAEIQERRRRAIMES